MTTTTPSPTHIYKLVEAGEWERSIQQQGFYQGSELDVKDGFMHLSSKEEVELSAKVSKYTKRPNNHNKYANTANKKSQHERF